MVAASLNRQAGLAPSNLAAWPQCCGSLCR